MRVNKKLSFELPRWSWALAYECTPPQCTPPLKSDRNLCPVSAKQKAPTPAHPTFRKTPHQALPVPKILHPEQESDTSTSSPFLWQESSLARRDAPTQLMGEETSRQ